MPRQIIGCNIFLYYICIIREIMFFKNFMLNIEDIKRRLKENPEPKEVGEIRELITNSFKDLEFVEDGHKYYLHNADGTKTQLKSVSETIHQFEPYVDWDEKAENKALSLGITTDELKKQWHENNIISTACGSKTHWFGEQAMNMFIGKEELTKKNMPFQYTEDGYLIPYCPKEWAITQYYTDIMNNNNVYPIMPEAKIYTNYNEMFNIKEPYAGTFDILLAYRYKGEIVCSIHDFKTNKELFKQYQIIRNVKMLPPFDKMDFYDQPYHHYTIQLNCYQIGLMQLGLKIVDRCIIWLKDDGTYEKIKVPDITETLVKIL